MKEVMKLDGYRHKLVTKVTQPESYEQIKRYLLTAIKSLNKQEINQSLIDKFIDKCINQLNGLSLLEADIRTSLNIKYAKSQLEIIKRHVGKIVGNYITPSAIDTILIL